MSKHTIWAKGAKRIQDRSEVRWQVEPEAMGIERVLHWVFGVEGARLCFDDAMPGRLSGISAEWLLAERGNLGGVKIDGGGRTPLPDDAELLAALVSALPVARGGRSMALLVAKCAAAGTRPDALVDMTPRVEPAALRRTCVGMRAKEVQVGWAKARDRSGRLRDRPVMMCPITYSPPPAKIASMRRGYLQWRGALDHLRIQAQTLTLRRWRVTDAMPPLRPWLRDGEN